MYIGRKKEIDRKSKVVLGSVKITILIKKLPFSFEPIHISSAMYVKYIHYVGT
jgi:hypothetical protein